MSTTQVLTQTSQTRPWIKNLVLVLGASALIAIAAQIRIPLPFTPVPISMQSFAVLMFAALLGSKRGSLAVIAYLAEGALGLPVFSGGQSGLYYLTGATGGYLAGFVVAAFVTGWIMERAKTRPLARAAFALAMGNFAIYALGVTWLAQYVGIKGAITMGLVPFLIGDAVKFVLALYGTRALKAFKHRA